MRTSARLSAVAALAGSGRCVADVGCDHGYLCISLLQEGRYRQAIAMDLREGPLQAARAHCVEAGMEGRIECRQSDGCAALRPGEADTIVCAGMGGALMRDILMRGEALARKASRIVLQPQSEVPQLRRYLREAGYLLLAEDMVSEAGKYYPMMAVADRAAVRVGDDVNAADGSKAGGVADNDAGAAGGREAADGVKAYDRGMAGGTEGVVTQALMDAYGPMLLASGHPVLRAFLMQEVERLRRVQAGLEAASAAKPRIVDREIPGCRRQGRLQCAADEEDAGYRRQERLREVTAELALAQAGLALMLKET